MSANARLENGVVVFMCGGRRRHAQSCKYCSRPAIARCDWKTEHIEEGAGIIVTPCDALLCGQCADKKGPVDHCRIHRLRGDTPGGITEITK